jgi:pimeloyl-ACP methyl ester carboxylesterase
VTARLAEMRTFRHKHKASIRGHTLEYLMSGSGRPPIVLINGAGGPVEGWYKVYGALAAIGTVFAYNRPGIGGSDKPKEPQTALAGKPAFSWLTPSRISRARLDNQRALCALSPRSRQFIAARSGHFPQFSEPEVIVQAVREVAQWATSR